MNTGLIDSVLMIDTKELSYEDALATLEAAYLEKTMKDTKYNQSRAAIKMGLSRGTLRTKLREHFGSLYFRDAE